jgi:sterol desaturase/sphingolipid hydroxylase (fatty acid hydroxylase superfamily)
MGESIFGNEVYIRLGFFFGVFGAMALWEKAAPRRGLTTSKAARWANNLGITLLDTILVRLLFAAGAVGLAIVARERGWGLLNLLEAPFWAKVVIGAIALDFVIYAQHNVFHSIPLFWRLHKVHHTDLDIDVTTGIRFHPLEIVLSMLIKIAAVFSLGAPPLSVVIFEVALNATSMFNHGNVRMPQGLDRFLRLFVVTPDMHRVHHSVIIKEFNSNFGFNLPWWDRLLGTYRAQPARGHEGMTIGLANFREAKALNLWSLLALPFRAGK